MCVQEHRKRNLLLTTWGASENTTIVSKPTPPPGRWDFWRIPVHARRTWTATFDISTRMDCDWDAIAHHSDPYLRSALLLLDDTLCGSVHADRVGSEEEQLHCGYALTSLKVDSDERQRDPKTHSHTL